MTDSTLLTTIKKQQDEIAQLKKMVNLLQRQMKVLDGRAKRAYETSRRNEGEIQALKNMVRSKDR